MSFQAQSDFIGPLPSGSNWQLSVAPVGNETDLIASFGTSTNVTQQLLTTMDTTSQWAFITNKLGLEEGHQLQLTAQLRDPSNQVIDQGSIQLPWTNSRGLPVQLLLKGQGTQSGLTPLQAQQLQEVHDQTFLSKVIDALTLVEITNGPTGDPVTQFLVAWNFGIIVRLTTIPDGLAPITPDEQYWLPTLATVRLFRGNDLWLRVPIHTPTKLIPFANENLIVALSAITPTQWALQLTVQVNFLPGVEGQVFRMVFP
jgi:hypothetical protein